MADRNPTAREIRDEIRKRPSWGDPPPIPKHPKASDVFDEPTRRQAWEILVDDDLWDRGGPTAEEMGVVLKYYRGGCQFEDMAPAATGGPVIDAPFRIIEPQPEPKYLDAPPPE